MIFDCAQIIGKYLNFVEVSFLKEHDCLDQLFRFFILLNKYCIWSSNSYSINLSKEKYLYNTELKDYVENSMIVALNIYKILTLYYSGENTLRFNHMFLEFIGKNQQTYLLNKYIDQEFLIIVIKK